jgi:magnesium chelatase family protein
MRVISAREAQTERFKGLEIHCNAQMGSKTLKEVCALDDAGAFHAQKGHRPSWSIRPCF